MVANVGTALNAYAAAAKALQPGGDAAAVGEGEAPRSARCWNRPPAAPSPPCAAANR